MTISARTLTAAGALLMATGFGNGDAFARSATFTRSFTTPRGTVTQTETKSFTPSTGVASISKTTDFANGKTASASLTSVPDGRGGFVDTRSFTNVAGKTFTSSRQVGR